jgi:hypothetical protein
MELDGYIISTIVASIIVIIALFTLVAYYGSEKDLFSHFLGGIAIIALIVSIVVIVLEWFYPEYAPSTLLSGGYEWIEDGWYDIMELLGLYSTEDSGDVDELVDAQDEFENNEVAEEEVTEEDEFENNEVAEEDVFDEEPEEDEFENNEVAEEDVFDEEPEEEDNVETMINIEPFAQANKDTFIAYVKSIYGPLYGKMASMLYNTEAIQALRSQADREAAIENIINKHISGNKRGFKRILKGILKKRRNPLA